MTFIQAVRFCLRKGYLDYKGRASKSEYWYYMLFSAVLFTASGYVMFQKLWLGAILLIYFFIPFVTLISRRFHDIGKSSKWYMIIGFFGILTTYIFTIPGVSHWYFFIPTIFYLVWFIILIVIGSKKGVVGPNKYGDDPKMINKII